MATYNGYHSIDIYLDSENVRTGSKKNTWNDFRLVAEKRPSVNPPEPKSEYVEVPGMDGSLDYSDILSGYPSYNDRTGSWDFIVVNDFYEPVSTHEEWYETYTKVMAYIQGKKVKVILEDDLEHYYRGRLHVSDYSSGNNYSTLTIEYHLEPFKYSIYSTNDAKWLWDPFNFYTGHITQEKFVDEEIPSWNRAANGDWLSRKWKSFVVSPSDIGTAPVVPYIEGLVQVDYRCNLKFYDQEALGPSLLFQIADWDDATREVNTNVGNTILRRRLPEYVLRSERLERYRTIKCCCKLTKTIPQGFMAEADMPYHITKCPNCNKKFNAFGDAPTSEYTTYEPIIDIPTGNIYIKCGNCNHQQQINTFKKCPNCDQPFNDQAWISGQLEVVRQSANYKLICKNCNHEYTRPYSPDVARISIDIRRSDF